MLPIASLIEFAGVLDLLTNESFVGPVDLGFSVLYLVSANVQGLDLIMAGSAMMLYTFSQLK